jgi:hypothetical protein
MTEKQRSFLLFEDWRDVKLAAIGREPWITVFQSSESAKDHNYGIYTVLLPAQGENDVLAHSHWDATIPDHYAGTSKSYDGEVSYYRHFGGESEVLPIVLSRYFFSVIPPQLEVLEEFRLFHNLYEDRATGCLLKITEGGNREEVVRITSTTVEMRLRELRQFASAKRRLIACMFDLKRFVQGSIEEVPEKLRESELVEKSSLLRYDFYTGTLDPWDKVFSRLLGKKLIAPLPISQIHREPFGLGNDEEVEFIIGVDELDEPVQFTSNEDRLANFFGANKGAPQYTTPVFFRKEVMTKYYANTDLYTVEDGLLRCAGLWYVRIDNDHPDCVMVLLGDLGRDLPLEERKYWRTFNIPPDGRKMSVANFKRSFMVEHADPREPEHRFQSAYGHLVEPSEEAVVWPILLPLTREDQHHVKALHIPITTTQAEFDLQVLGLTKAIIDSLNEARLKELLAQVTDKRGIALLEEVCKALKIDGHENHIQYLRDLQSLRSSGAAHRKGSNYAKAAKRFGATEQPLPKVFREILESAIRFLNWARSAFSKQVKDHKPDH